MTAASCMYAGPYRALPGPAYRDPPIWIYLKRHHTVSRLRSSNPHPAWEPPRTTLPALRATGYSPRALASRTHSPPSNQDHWPLRLRTTRGYPGTNSTARNAVNDTTDRRTMPASKHEEQVAAERDRQRDLFFSFDLTSDNTEKGRRILLQAQCLAIQAPLSPSTPPPIPKCSSPSSFPSP